MLKQVHEILQLVSEFMFCGILVIRYLEAQCISQFVPVHACCSMVQMAMAFEDMGSV
jgi:hypothetical protein